MHLECITEGDLANAVEIHKEFIESQTLSTISELSSFSFEVEEEIADIKVKIRLDRF